MKNLTQRLSLRIWSSILIIVAISIGLIACGEDNGLIRNCDNSYGHCGDNGIYSTPAVRWKSDLAISSHSIYKEFLQDLEVCDFGHDTPLHWSYHLGYDCKDWDDEGYLTLELQDKEIPSQGRVIFRALNPRWSLSKDIPISGEFTSINNSTGFTMWSRHDRTYDLGNILKVVVEDGNPEERQLRVDLYYKGKKFAHSFVRNY